MALRRALAAACALAAAAPASSLGAAPPIETIAGNGVNAAFTVPDVPMQATEVSFRGPTAVIDGPGAVGIVFPLRIDHRVLSVFDDGSIGHRAGTGVAGYSGDGTSAPTAALNAPQGVGYLSGPVYILVADTGNNCIRAINVGLPGDLISTHAGSCNSAAPPNIQTEPAKRLVAADGLPAAVFYQPVDVEPFLDGSSYWVANETVVRQVVGDNVTTAAGTTSTVAAPTEGGSPTSGYLTAVRDVAAGTTAGTFFIAANGEIGGGTPREVDHVYKVSSGQIRTAAGGGASSAENISATTAKLQSPTAVVGLADGGFLVYDGGNAKIRRVTSGTPGTIRTIVGNGIAGLSPDGTPADQASIRSSGRLAVTDRGLVISQGQAGTGGLIRRVPATAILTGPSGFTQSRSATFTLGSWDDQATFQCKGPGEGSFTACHSFSNLSDGQHTFTAKATTNGGTMVDSPGATRTWTVDTTPPSEIALVSPAAGASEVPPSPTFDWDAATDANGVERYELWIDGAKNADAGTATEATPATPLAEGPHTWQVKAFDVAGNERPSETRSFVSGSAPVAALTVSPNPALVGRDVTLDASASSDASGPVARFEWDFEGDGTFDQDSGTTAATTHAYPAAGTFNPTVRVTDGAGITTTASQELRVTAPSGTTNQFGVTINAGAQYTRTPDVTVSANFPAGVTQLLVSNDGGFLTPITFPAQREVKWRLDSSGPERLPKIVYVRFLTGPFVSETHTDDIILDETPPQVTGATLAGAAATANRATASARRTLRIRARDNVSGVASMQVTKTKRRPGRVRRFSRRVAVAARGPVYVRVRDKAGNWSRWRKAR